MKKLFFIAAMLLITGLSFGQQKKSTTKKTSESISVSISNSDEEYALTASFNSGKNEIVEPLIIKALGKATETNSKESTWERDDVYTISLKNNRLNISLNKERASGSLYKSIAQLGQDIQKVLTKSNSTETSN